MAITIDDPARLEGTQVRGGDGSKLGSVEAVYYDNDTDRPEWVSVRSGLFGSHVSIMPLRSADYDGNELRVPYDKDALRSAPHHDPGRELSPRDEDDLFRHYGMSHDGDAHREARGTARDGDEAMTRSEERLRVGTETHESGRARLRKRVVTEHQQVDVPVSHEEVRVEREPITDANRDAAYRGPEITEDEHEVTLHEERPVVGTEAVPVERVRLGTEQVRDTEHVGRDVRHEEIDVDGDGTDGDGTDRRRR
ncbi:DUF2382 domain-containing protein [Pseudonocardia sichuanensis]|uniref:Uncharacterized protein (TIGR02271 family) n=1 Tax=Pseudonocardia kunmingensis TaxID=630975 RepID=A0A543DA22_9PSEU|nr:PRC and DUF2382 domain-containing protein [Pseudonocardia kunmingensis]TQM06160.1 uncharacterized protein (TIGR02271 family) [Pseudonocardia kunmingensis]